jgi:hypothetical protein
VNDAIEAHADLNVEMPEGPSKFLYADKEECRKILERDGFDGESVVFETDLVNGMFRRHTTCLKPSATPGVRTAGLLARQSSDRLDAIGRAVEDGVRRYAKAMDLPFRWPRTLSSHRNACNTGFQLVPSVGMPELHDCAAAA